MSTLDSFRLAFPIPEPSEHPIYLRESPEVLLEQVEQAFEDVLESIDVLNARELHEPESNS